MLLLLLFIVLIQGYSTGWDDTLCYFRLSDVTASEFFAQVNSTGKNVSVFRHRQTKHVGRYENVYDYCDISTTNESVKFVMDDPDEFADFVDLLDIKELKTLRHFYSIANSPIMKNVTDMVKWIQTRKTEKNDSVILRGSDVPLPEGVMYRTAILASETSARLQKNNFTLPLYDRRVRNGSYERRVLISETKVNVFQRMSQSVQDFVGVYKFDKYGRRGFSMVESTKYAILNHEDHPGAVEKLVKNVKGAFSRLTSNMASRVSYLGAFFFRFIGDPAVEHFKTTLWESFPSCFRTKRATTTSATGQTSG